MKAEEVIRKLANHEPNILGYDYFKKYSFLLPLVEIDGETHLLFEVRSFTMRSQPGDVCFPGGRVDADDKNELHGALRETEEELGINEKHIQHVIPLDYIVSDFGRIIYPFIGYVTNLDEMDINEKEVAEVFTVPLNYFLENEPKKYKINFEVIPE